MVSTKRSHRSIFLAGLLAASLACAAPGPAVQEQVFDTGALTITRLTLQDSDGPPVRY
jgi:hypothetical protein